MKKILRTLCCLLLLAACAANAADYKEAFRKLAARAAEQSTKYWQGRHFGDHPYPDTASVYDGRNVHDYTMMYWNFLNAKLNHSEESLKRALAHYDFTVSHFWDKEKKRFRTGYDFLSNTSILMSILLSLRDAREVIPEEIRNDMLLRSRAIAAYLPTYTTALLNNRDLRANNQDAFAAFALSLAAEELNDPQIRKDALEKFRSVLARVQQSFWIEGGVDIGYQSVGEPAFMAAADLLWEELSHEEKVRIANLQLSNLAGNGFGIENARSTSWINPQPVRTFSSALLGRVPNEFIAADAESLFLKTAEKGFPSKWWLHDPAALSFFSGFYKYQEKIAAMSKRNDKFASGSLACQIMQRDEQNSYFTGMEKAYLTGTLGTTAIFGDYSRLHATQMRKKFGAAHLPFTPNPGDLRYLGKDLHLYIIPDDTLGAPRLFAKDSFRYPQTLHRASYPGAGASEYILTRILPGMNEEPPITVRQTFAVIGDVLAVVFDSSMQNAGLAYGVTMPIKTMEQKGNTLFLHQQGISDTESKLLTVSGYNILPAILQKERWNPFFQDEMRINGKQKKLPQLRLVRFPFGKGARSVLLFSPGGNAKQIRFSEQKGMLLLEFTTGTTNYTAVVASSPMETMTFETKTGIRVTIKSPRPGYLQTVGFSAEKLKTFAVNGTGFALNSKNIFKAKQKRTVSAECFADTSLLTCDGPISLSETIAPFGSSLVDGRKWQFPAELPADRLILKKKL